jgi:hypothetical protein
LKGIASFRIAPDALDESQKGIESLSSIIVPNPGEEIESYILQSPKWRSSCPRWSFGFK